MRSRRIHIGSGERQGPLDADAPADTAGPEPRRPGIRHAVIACALLAVASVGLAVTNLFLTLDPEQIGDWIEPHASAMLNRPVRIGGAAVTLWPRPSVRIHGVSVASPAAYDGPPLALVDEARLDVAWLPLVVGRVHVRRLALDGARLHLAVDAQGNPNFGDLVPRASSGETPPAPVALRIRRVDVTDGTLTYSDGEGDRSLVVLGGEANVQLARDARDPVGGEGWHASVRARSDSLHLRIAGLGAEIVRATGPTATLQVHRAPTGTLEIDEGHIVIAEDSLAVYGSLALGAREPTFDMIFTNEGLAADFLTAFFPPATRSDLLPRVEGTLDVIVQLQGGAGAPPALRGAVRLADVALRIRGEPMIDRLRGVIAVGPDTLSLEALEGRFAGGPFELSGIVRRSAGAAAFVVRGEPDLDAFDRLGLLPPGTTLSGGAKVYLSVAGPSTALDSLEVVGEAEVSGLQVEHTRLGAPLYVPAGKVSLLGREARWSALPVLVGRDRLVTSGRIEDLFDVMRSSGSAPTVEIIVEGPRLDLDRVLPPSDSSSSVTYPQLALAHLGGRLVDGRTASVVAAQRGLRRPERLWARGSVQLRLDTLTYGPHVLTALSGLVELHDSSLAVPEATFEAWAGDVTASLSLGTGSRPDAPFALRMALAGADAAAFLAATSPVGEAVTGTLDLELEIEGATDASLLPLGRDLSGRVALRLEDGEVGGTGVNLALADFLGAESWTSLPYTSWVMDIRLRERTLEFREAHLSGSEGRVAFTGPIRLDGSSDLSMGVSIPPQRLAGVSLRRTGIAQSVLDRLRAAGGSLDLGLRLGGWLQAPTLEPDASQALALVGTRR